MIVAVTAASFVALAVVCLVRARLALIALCCVWGGRSWLLLRLVVHSPA
jgi:hypothetical protein